MPPFRLFSPYFAVMLQQVILGLGLLIFTACDGPPQRNCTAFKTGRFSFTAVIEGKMKKTTFYRTSDMEVAYFEGKRDTSSVRWINDCEYVVKNKHPKNRAEEKAIHIKILTTSDSSYTFEYSLINDTQKFKGTAYKLH